MCVWGYSCIISINIEGIGKLAGVCSLLPSHDWGRRHSWGQISPQDWQEANNLVCWFPCLTAKVHGQNHRKTAPSVLATITLPTQPSHRPWSYLVKKLPLLFSILTVLIYVAMNGTFLSTFWQTQTFFHFNNRKSYWSVKLSLCSFDLYILMISDVEHFLILVFIALLISFWTCISLLRKLHPDPLFTLKVEFFSFYIFEILLYLEY